MTTAPPLYARCPFEPTDEKHPNGVTLHYDHESRRPYYGADPLSILDAATVHDDGYGKAYIDIFALLSVLASVIKHRLLPWRAKDAWIIEASLANTKDWRERRERANAEPRPRLQTMKA